MVTIQLNNDVLEEKLSKLCAHKDMSLYVEEALILFLEEQDELQDALNRKENRESFMTTSEVLNFLGV